MLLLFALARPIHLHTFAEANLTAIGELDPSTSPCDDIDRCRTISDILWNCYSVVLLCTWLAIHPDVPSVHDSVTVVLMKYGLIVFMAIVAPELMVLWALRQYVSCYRIANKYKGYGWQKSHAFLALMGGLALYDGDQYVCHLWDRKHFDEYIDPTDRQFRRSKDNGFEMRVAVGIEKQLGFDEIDLDLNNELSEKCHEGYERADAIIAKELRAKYSCLLEFLLARGYINLTEDEIKDKGHADALSKSIAIVQTSWFILQCFARAAQGLDVTAIEVVTFAFAVLNFVTYFLWWNKPLRVRHPVRVYWMPYPRNNSKREVVVKSVADMKPWEVFKILFRKLGDTIVRWFQATRSELRAAADYIAEDYKALSSEKVFFFLRYPQRFPIFAPLYPIAALCTRFRDLGAGCESDDFRYLFSSRLQHDPPQIYATVYMAAVLFAAIHCVPWFFHFPTAIEQLLWRISAFLVTVAPIVFLCLHLSGIHILRPMVDKAHRGPLGILGTVVITSVGVFWILLISSMYIFYVGARLALIILALTTLRDLPRDGYEAVDWNKFLPHIG